VGLGAGVPNWRWTGVSIVQLRREEFVMMIGVGGLLWRRGDGVFHDSKDVQYNTNLL